MLYPLERLKLATAQGKKDLIESHATFFKDEATHLEATPTLILEKRREGALWPPATDSSRATRTSGRRWHRLSDWLPPIARLAARWRC